MADGNLGASIGGSGKRPATTAADGRSPSEILEPHGLPPHLRCDAERNRRRLLEVAAAAFAEQGFEVSIEEIARRAGLGKGTVFRRFPTKDCLVSAIVCERIAAMLQTGQELLESADPTQAFRSFMHGAVSIMSADRGLLEASCGLAAQDADVRAAKQRVLDLVRPLLSRAQAAGGIRNDIEPVDVMLLSVALGYVTGPLRTLDDAVWERYFDLVFDGLRAENRRPPSRPAPAEEAVRDAMAEWGGRRRGSLIEDGGQTKRRHSRAASPS